MVDPENCLFRTLGVVAEISEIQKDLRQIEVEMLNALPGLHVNQMPIKVVGVVRLEVIVHIPIVYPLTQLGVPK